MVSNNPLIYTRVITVEWVLIVDESFESFESFQDIPCEWNYN